MSAAPDAVDVAALGYPAVRQAFDEVLQLCVARLGKADLRMAWDTLGVDDPAALADDPKFPDIDSIACDTALYTRPGGPVARLSRKRPIDRIARKLAATRDKLDTMLAARLPSAFFSVFEIAEAHADGRLTLLDLLDDARRIPVIDIILARRVKPGALLAARFVDLGPWHIGFGIAVTLRRSEAAAIILALGVRGPLKDSRDDLHELIYGCRLHDQDLVMEAVTPVIAALAVAVDSGLLPMADVVAGLGSLTPGSRPLAAE